MIGSRRQWMNKMVQDSATKNDRFDGPDLILMRNPSETAFTNQQAGESDAYKVVRTNQDDRENAEVFGWFNDGIGGNENEEGPVEIPLANFKSTNECNLVHIPVQEHEPYTLMSVKNQETVQKEEPKKNHKNTELKPNIKKKDSFEELIEEKIQAFDLPVKPSFQTVIYDSKFHQYSRNNDKLTLRKRKPTRSVDIADLKYYNEGSDFSDDSESRPQKPIGEKNKLLVLMMTLFEGKDLRSQQIDSLTLQERQILASLVQRKFTIKFGPTDTPSNIASAINNQRHHSKPKRLEENYKLVFKKALKYLLRKFKRHHEVKGKKPDLELGFYRFYFEEAFKRDGVEEEMGLDPTSAIFKSQSLFNPKTINSKYVTNVLKSKDFLTHFQDFLENHFLTDYNKSREYKIQKVVEKCYECFTKKNKGGEEDVKKYVEKNPKCKLPWSDQELIAARKCVRELIEKKLDKINSSSTAMHDKK